MLDANLICTMFFEFALLEFGHALSGEFGFTAEFFPELVNAPIFLATLGAIGRFRKTEGVAPVLIQEEAGFHLGISRDLKGAGRHAASMVKEFYSAWYESDWAQGSIEYKRNYFTIAVGGGNTIKEEYRALLDLYSLDIDWIKNVRFFFLEESSGEPQWESAKDSLVNDFIRPLADKLIAKYGTKEIAARLDLNHSSQQQEIEQALIETMTYPYDLSQVKRALDAGDKEQARDLARFEGARYKSCIEKLIGSSMAFHLIITGISKEGGIGAFAPYTPALKEKEPGVAILEQSNGAVRIALNRGVFTNAERVSLLISGSLKLKALGRFEMEESVDFETTVMETPLRLFRENYETAQKVHIFADDQALHIDECVLSYREDGEQIVTKAEVREGHEDDGIHILLLHGFMGLYTYINLLIRLPSAWKVSALHRGKKAKTLTDQKVFPQYAKSLRKAILQNWHEGRPTPTGFHSLAGVISDHLLTSVVEGVDGPLPKFEDLKKEDQNLIEALRVGGMIQMAAWAPSDTYHIVQSISNLVAHVRSKAPLDYGSPDRVYLEDDEGGLRLNEYHEAMKYGQVAIFGTLLKFPTTEYFIYGVNLLLRSFFQKASVQQRMSNRETPYAFRIVGGRLIKKVSLYGLLKEFHAAVHDSQKYQDLHLRALDIIYEYDIPYLSIIHKDDAMVSANRHREEHEHLLSRRMKKEGVSREEDLKVPARFILLEREAEELQLDPVNPHLMFLSTSHEGGKIARQVTAAMTRFVNENVAAAIKQGKTKTLSSVKKWVKEHPSTLVRSKKRKNTIV